MDERVLKYAPWSVSKVGVLEKCSKQFDLKYVKKVQEPRGSSHARLGVAIHLVLEKALETDSQLDKPNFVDSCLAELTEKQAPTTEETIQIKLSFLDIIEFARKLRGFCEKNKVVKILREEKLAISKTLTPATFFDTDGLLRGVIDLGLLTASNDLIIIDHKTGKKRDVSFYSAQLNSYMIMGVINYPEVRSIQCGLHYVGKPVVWMPSPEGTNRAWAKEEIQVKLFPWLPMYLGRFAHKLDIISCGKAEPELGWMCEWCGFADETNCPEGYLEAQRRLAKKSASM